jgi:hypothetical protein
MLYNSLPWPTWRADLAPDYTLFMPVTSRSSTIYQNQIPSIRPGEASGGGGGNEAAAAPTSPNQPVPQPAPPTAGSSSGIELRNIGGRSTANSAAGGSRNDIESRSGQQALDNNASSTSASSLGIFARFFAPANYESINPNSSNVTGSGQGEVINSLHNHIGGSTNSRGRVNNGYTSLNQSDSIHGSNGGNSNI